ncbi:hypothetical protein FB639_001114, partial [Coemansia asiatica]
MPRRTRKTQIVAASSEEEDNTIVEQQQQQQSEEVAQNTDTELQQSRQQSEDVEEQADGNEEEPDAEQPEHDEDEVEANNDADDDEDEPEVFNDAQDALDEETHESSGDEKKAIFKENEEEEDPEEEEEEEEEDQNDDQEQQKPEEVEDESDVIGAKKRVVRRSEAPNTVDMNDALTKARAIAAKLGTSMQRPMVAASAASESAPSANANSANAVGQNDNTDNSHEATEHGARQMDTRERRSASPSEHTGVRGGQASRGHKRGRSTSRDRGYQRSSMDARRDSRRRFDGPKPMGSMPPIGSEPHHGPMLEFQVPMDMVGLIIGRQGSNLRSIEQRHGVRIQMSQQFDRRDPERKITIEGPTQAAEDARMDIVEFIDKHDSSKQAPPFRGGRAQQPISPMQPGFGADRLPGGGNSGPSSPPGMTTIMVPNAKVGLIIGRGGESIREIQKLSGARVQVEPDNGRGAPERPIQLIGLPAQIEFARTRIVEIVNSERPAGRDPMSGPGFGRPSMGQPQGMPQPQHYQQQAPQPQQPFSPRGGPLSQPPSFGMSQRGGFADGMPAMPQPQHVEEMQVPSEAVGIIIGRGGENIKHLQQASGARIQIIQGQDRSAPFKPVTISGDQAACMRARRMIEEKIQSVQ